MAKQDKRVQQLLKAADQGDVARIKALLADGVDVNASASGETALEHAAVNNKKAAVAALIHAGATAKGNPNLLGEAAKYADAEMVRMLIAAGAEINPKPRQDYAEMTRRLHAGEQVKLGRSALEEAANRGKHEILRVLLEHGADVAAKFHEDALPDAIAGKHEEAALILIEAGALPMKKRAQRDGLLALAAEEGLKRVVKALLDAGASPDARGEHTRDNGSALMAAAAGGHIEVVKLLMEAGATVRLRDDEGRTALDWAREFKPKNVEQIVQLLQSAGAAPGGAEEEPRPPDLESAAKAPQFLATLKELEKLSKRKAQNWSEVKGGRCFPMVQKEARKFVDKHQAQFLQRGCLLLRCDRGVGALPTSDDLDAILALDTNGDNFGIRPLHILRWVRENRQTWPMTILSASFDTLELKFKSPIKDATKLAKRIMEICPELEEEGSAKNVAERVTAKGEVTLWWG
jgi:ankyrin repeat protein